MKKAVKQSGSAKRVEEIEAIQERIRKLSQQYAEDFTEPSPMDSMVKKDLQASIDSLDLLKRLYKAKTEPM